MPTQKLIYDPLRVFVDAFSQPSTANDVGEALTCLEVNALVGLLEFCGATAAASWYLDAHRKDPDNASVDDDDDPLHGCAEPGMH